MPPSSRSQPQRTIRLLRSPAHDGVGVFCVTTKNDSSSYTMREIPCEIGGRGFEVHRTGLGTLYHVRVGEPQDCSCECKGFYRWGYCRHVLGLLALIQAKKI